MMKDDTITLGEAIIMMCIIAAAVFIMSIPFLIGQKFENDKEIKLKEMELNAQNSIVVESED